MSGLAPSSSSNVPYTKQLWHNDNTLPPYGPLNSTRLNHIEDGIANAGGSFEAPSLVFNVQTYGALGDAVTQDADAIQSCIDACDAAGGGVVWIPFGTYLIATTLTIPSNVTIQGVGNNLSVLKASGSVTPVLTNEQTGGMVQRINLSAFSVLGNSGTANGQGICLAGVELSAFRDLRISGFTGTGQIPLVLTSWSDSGTYRPCRENDFYGIETVGTNGIKLTKHASDPSTSGCNNNKFFAPRCSAYTSIGINIDAGEGNSVYGSVCSTPTDATTGIRVNDDVNAFYSCNTDCSFGGGNTATGVLITSGVNDTFVISRTGNGPTTPIDDQGTNSVIIRHPLTHIGGTVKFGSASTGLGFFGASTHGLVNVTGSRGGNAALANLLTALADYGLITDSTT